MPIISCFANFHAIIFFSDSSKSGFIEFSRFDSPYFGENLHLAFISWETGKIPEGWRQSCETSHDTCRGYIVTKPYVGLSHDVGVDVMIIKLLHSRLDMRRLPQSRQWRSRWTYRVWISYLRHDKVHEHPYRQHMLNDMSGLKCPGRMQELSHPTVPGRNRHNEWEHVTPQVWRSHLPYSWVTVNIWAYTDLSSANQNVGTGVDVPTAATCMWI